MSNQYYKEFKKLYEQYGNRLDLGGTFLWRLQEGHYKERTYKTVVTGIEWFINNFNPKEYTLRISYTTVNKLWLCIENNAKNLEFVFHWAGNKAILNEVVTGDRITFIKH